MKLLDAFIGVNLTAGSHTVEMEYHPKGLKTGALITIASLLLLLVMVWIERKLMLCWEDCETGEYDRRKDWPDEEIDDEADEEDYEEDCDEEEFSEDEFYEDEFSDDEKLH